MNLFFRLRFTLLPLVAAVLLLHAYSFAQTHLAILKGHIIATNPHPQAGVSQSITGFRFGGPVDGDPGIEIGAFRSSAGWFFDSECFLSDHFRLGEGSGDALLVVGVPFGLMGDPFWIAGVDVTLGPGVVLNYPAEPVELEFRAETLTNFLSGIMGLSGTKTYTNSQTGSSTTVSGRPFYLLLRLAGGIWYPLGSSTAVHLGITHFDFHAWQMTSAVLAFKVEL